MKYRLTIKRVSSFIPTVCLIALLLLIGLMVWLCTVGLPSWALRSLEEEAARQGIYLRLGSLRLSPSAGFALRGRDLRLYRRADDAEPLAHVDKALVSLRFTSLIFGELVPSRMQLVNGSLALPLADAPDPVFNLRSLQADLVFSDKGKSAEGDLRFSAEEIPVSIECRLKFTAAEKKEAESDASEPEESDSGPSEPSDFSKTLDELIAAVQPAAREISSLIRTQKWTDLDRPSFKAEVRVEDEHLDATVHASVPVYETRDFHFREAVVEAQMTEDVITINAMRFKTVDPDSSVSLRAAYSIPTHELSFRLRSTSALVPIARKVFKNPPPLLSKFNHGRDDAPKISVSGDLSFDDVFELEHARATATLEQRNLKVGASTIDELQLSFSYNDGDFNVDRLDAVYGGGKLSLQAHATQGKGDITASGRVPVAPTLALISEFTEGPVALPSNLQLGETVDFRLRADIGVSFREGEMLTLRNTVPYLHDLELSVSSDQVILQQAVALTGPQVNFRLRELGSTEGKHLPNKAASLSCDFAADEVAVEALEGVPRLRGVTVTFAAEDFVMTDFTDLKTLAVSESNTGVHFDSLSFRDLLCGKTDIAMRNLGALLSEERSRQYTLDSLFDATCESVSYMNSPACSATLSVLPEGTATRGKVELTLLQKEPTSAAPAGEQAAEEEAPELAGAPLDGLSPEAATAQTAQTAADADADAAASDPAPREGRLAFSYDVDPGRSLAIDDIRADLPLASFAPLFAAFKAEVHGMDLPNDLRFTGQLFADLESGCIRRGQLSLSIPELVRRCSAVKAQQGMSETVGIQLEVQADTPEGSDDLFCRAKLQLDHESGSFSAQISGCPTEKLHLTGRSTMRLDVIDRLIDNMDAHSVICDFKVGDQSSTLIDNIVLDVDYGEGLKLCFDGDVTFDNIGYQLCAYRLPSDQMGRFTGDQWLRTDLGPDPFVSVKSMSCHVKADVGVDRCDAAGAKIPDVTRIDITRPVIVYDNRPWIRRNGFKKGVGETVFRGDRVSIDLEAGTLEIVKASGKIYPAYSLGMFYADLFEYLKDLSIPRPIDVSTDYCLIPIDSSSVVPMTGAISCKADTPVSYNIGIDVPLENFSGIVHLSDDYVTLDHLNAGSWGGVLDGIVRIGITGPRSTLDGYLKAESMDLSLIAKSLDSDQNFALCSGEFRFQAASPELRSLQGYGYLQAVSGDLMKLQIFLPISEVLTNFPEYVDSVSEKLHAGSFSASVLRGISGAVSRTSDVIDGIGDTATRIPFANHFIKYSLTEAYTRFDMINGHVITRSAKAIGCNLNVALQLDIDMDAMTLKGNLWPKVNSIPTILLSPVTVLSNFMFDIVIEGPLDNLHWSLGLDDNLKGGGKKGQLRLPRRPVRDILRHRKKDEPHFDSRRSRH